MHACEFIVNCIAFITHNLFVSFQLLENSISSKLTVWTVSHKADSTKPAVHIKDVRNLGSVWRRNVPIDLQFWFFLPPESDFLNPGCRLQVSFQEICNNITDERFVNCI